MRGALIVRDHAFAPRRTERVRGLGTKVYPVLHWQQHAIPVPTDKAAAVAAHNGSDLRKTEVERGKNLQR